MALYRRSYTSYEGPLTDERWRLTVLPRYAFQTVFESKLLTSLFTMCFVPHVIAMVLIYLRNNAAALQVLNLQALSLLNIDGSFFIRLFLVQTFLSFFLVTFVGPGLISPDLANNALPIYLSRPFSRREYVIGKLIVLLVLVSLITWIPGLSLIAVQTSEAGISWLEDNVRIAVGIVVGSGIWMLTISLIALALSAWIKLKPVATASLFGVLFIGAGFGGAANRMLELDPGWGTLMDLVTTMRMLWNWLLMGESVYEGLPAWSGLVSMLGVCAVCLFLLARKIRACEVVR